MSDLQILFVVRFAYPGPGMFQTEHDSIAARQAHLWAPERIEARFRTLEHVCLRTLRQQTDGGFRTIILTGDALPRPHADRLRDLAATLHGAEAVFYPAKQQQDALAEVIRPRVDRGGPPVAYIRQDDDDGVARRFVARTREAFRDVAPLFERHGKLALDFTKGMRLHLTPDGPRVQTLHETHLGVAQPVILRASNQRTGIHFPHHKLGRLMPSVTLPEVPMWVRGVDGTNDSRVRDRTNLLKPATDEDRAVLTDRFGLDLDAIAGSFR
ncbi:glycosyltransferase [Jannaschia sp. 2305UL9-9]|uniref:glycosyltransferase n=1 Tax=Jannaschia sp. 2305UL9-9 TaxID=3121638 RepID=UPI0035298E4B